MLSNIGIENAVDSRFELNIAVRRKNVCQAARDEIG